MPRKFQGQIHVRIPPELHEEIANEAFKNGESISGICAQALILRKALSHIDPWKAIKKIWKANKDIPFDKIQGDVDEALEAIRKQP